MDERIVAAYAQSRLRCLEHPGMTRREYVRYRRLAQRRLIWRLVAMLGAGALLAAGWWA